MLTFAYFTSAPDWLIIGGLIFILFGGQKIPEFAKGLGEGLREFKRAMDPSHPVETPPEKVETEKPADTTAVPAGAVTAGTVHETGQANR